MDQMAQYAEENSGFVANFINEVPIVTPYVNMEDVNRDAILSTRANPSFTRSVFLTLVIGRRLCAEGTSPSKTEALRVFAKVNATPVHDVEECLAWFTECTALFRWSVSVNAPEGACLSC